MNHRKEDNLQIAINLTLTNKTKDLRQERAPLTEESKNTDRDCKKFQGKKKMLPKNHFQDASLAKNQLELGD